MPQTIKIMDRESIVPLYVPTMDAEGFISVGGVKIGRWVRERGVLQIHDKDCRRTERRGTDCVEVKISQLVDLLLTFEY
jgi:hypothetical protein